MNIIVKQSNTANLILVAPKSIDRNVNYILDLMQNNNDGDDIDGDDIITIDCGEN